MQNVVSKNLLLLQQIFLRFVLDLRSQVSRPGVFSMNEHATLQLAVNTLAYDSNKMWSIEHSFINISKCSWPPAASKFGQKQYFGDYTVSITRVNQDQFDISVCMSQSTNSARLTYQVSSQLKGSVKLVTSPTFCLIPWNSLKKKPSLQLMPKLFSVILPEPVLKSVKGL